MIELIADVPIETRTREDFSYGDGRDDVHGHVTAVEGLSVRVDVEFPNGHVNLEGFAPSTPGNNARRALDRFVECHPAVPDGRKDEWSMQMDGVSVSLEGNWSDWVQQAHRYQTERPSKSILDCLALFKSWDEPNTAAVQGAIDRAKEATGLAENDSRDLSDRDREMLRESLNGLDNVHIPESY